MKKIGFAFLFSSALFFGQTNLSLEDCQKAFVQNNLSLLAAKYNISEAQADIVQAKIWDLPVASFQANVVDPENNKYFRIGQTKNFGISQLILLGSKRQNQIELAKSGTELASLQFRQLLENLGLELKQAYYSLYFDQKKLDNTKKQLSYMNELLSSYKVQVVKGNISLKDQVRLQAIVVSLNNDKVQITNDIISQEQTLKLITGIEQDIQVQLDEGQMESLLRKSPIDNLELLKNKAFENNADYLYSQKLIEANEKNYKLQSSLNTPDLTLGANWSQRGGVYNNEVNFSVGIPIPLWKQNKGNMQKAQYQVQEAQQDAAYQKLTLSTQVEAAYNNWQNYYQQYNSLQKKDQQDLQAVYNGVTSNFRKGNLSMMDFTDFMDSYHQTVLQISDMQNQLLGASEQLQHLVQTEIYY